MNILFFNTGTFYRNAFVAGVGRRPILILAMLTFVSDTVFSQLNLTQTSNAVALAQLLSGPGVVISNCTLSGDTSATGTFASVSSNLGLGQGVVLSTGKISDIPQSASAFASTGFINVGDVQLSTLTTGSVFDVAVLEFDIIPQGKVLQFNYVFASEEYPQFVCSPFNDVFGFFISGPNPAGGSYVANNLATLPNSALPVCINSVNPGVPGNYLGTVWSTGDCLSLGNTSLYVDNLNPVNPNIVYNGMTTVLTAMADVVPCQTYHLKIAIADVGDRLRDSGVFLDAYSFSSTPYNVDITSLVNTPGYDSTYRGCVDGIFTVSISSVQDSDVTVNLQVTGTATNGVDYPYIPSSVVIPAGQTSINIPLNPIKTGALHPAETVVLSMINPCTGLPITSDSLIIQDEPKASLTVNDSTLCKGQSAQFNAGGGVNYAWSSGGGLSNNNTSDPIASPSSTTDYTVTITTGSCSSVLSQKIYVSDPAVTITSSSGDSLCGPANIQLAPVATGGDPPYNYLWNNGNTISPITVSASGNYSVIATDAFGCTASASRNVVISDLSLAGSVTPVACFGDNNGAIGLVVTGNNAPFTYKWNDGVTVPTRSNLQGGNYSVTVTNSFLCSATASFLVTQPSAALSASATPHAVLCNGASTGGIALSVTGGTASYSFSWNNAANSQNLSNIIAGNYAVTVTDAGNCTATAAATVTQPTALGVSETHANENCFGQNTGSINISVTGGTSPYSYNWGSGVTSQNRTNLVAGSYNVTVTDNNGCSVTSGTVITQPAALTVATATTNPGCAGNSTGSVSLTVNGGSVPYSFSWNDGIINQNRSNLIAGNYSVTVTDANLCTSTASATITQPGTLGVTSSTNNVSCNGGNNGSVTLQVTGGSSPFTYSWNVAGNTSALSNLTAGTYDATVTDINSCSATITAVISEPTVLNATNASANITCFGAGNGSINISVTGGTSPYSYNWGSGVTSQNRTNLVAGSYNVTVTDNNGCSVTSGTVITQPAALTVATATTNPGCAGNSTGSVSLTVNGGSVPYSFSWNDGIINQNRSNLIAGNYSVTVTDANLCTSTASATITQPGTLGVTSSTNNVSCNGGNNGSVTLQVTGGSSPFTYSWNVAGNTSALSNLTAGTYDATVTDINSCSATITAVISEPTVLNATNASANITCFGAGNGSINISTTGGTSPYSYNWGNNITSQNRTNLVAGSYNVTITDNNGCSVTSGALITQPAALTVISSTTNPGCAGNSTGSVSLTVSGGSVPYSFNWNDGAATQNRNNLIAGNYSVTVTDANLCSSTASATITQPGTLGVTSSINNVSCKGGNNGSVTLQVTGGSSPYTYSWNVAGNTSSLSNLIAGTYDATVTDINSCSAAITAVISEPAVLSATNTSANISCFGAGNGSINISVTGGTSPYSYNWGSGVTSQNRTNLVAGSYTVTITDNNGCSINESSVITQPAALTVVTATTNPGCAGNSTGSVSLTISGGSIPYSFSWNDGITTQNRNNLNAGNYSVTVTDANLCSSTASATITQPGTLGVTSSTNNVSCNGGNNGSVTLQVTGGSSPYTYSWNVAGNTSILSNLVAGTYDATVTDINSCSAAITAVITEPTVLNATSTSANITCFGAGNGTINTSVTGGTSPYSYNWGSGVTSQNRTNLVAGSYNVTITDSNGCSINESAVITQPAALTVISSTTNPGCAGNSTGSVSLTVNGGSVPYSFSWNDGTATQNRNNLSASSYSVTVTDANLCSSTASATITQPGTLAVTSSISDVSCNGGNNGSVSLQVIGGSSPYTYSWNVAGNTSALSNLVAGTYDATVTDINSCSAAITAVISEPTVLNATSISANITCFGAANGSINISVTGGTSPYSYDWGNSVTSQNRTNLVAGSYNVTITDSNGCSINESSLIIQPAVLTVATATTNPGCAGNSTGSVSLTISGGSIPYSFNWNDGTATQNRNNLSAGNYSVTVTDANLCSLTASATITQPGILGVTSSTINVSCNGGNNGSVTLQVTGGSSPYTYSWNVAGNTSTLSNLVAATYNATVTDTNSCSATITAVISEPPVLSATSNVDNASCFGAANGSVNIFATGGTSPYSYNWGSGVTSQNRNNLLAGNYVVTITDLNLCTFIDSTVVSQASAVSIFASVTNVNCYGGNNGAVSLTVSGGASSYNYIWSDGVTDQSRSGLAAGSYNVTVNDINSCTAAAAVIVAQPASPVSATASVRDVSCNGGRDGSIILSVTGGTPLFTYRWNTGSQLKIDSGLNAGNYSVNIADSNGCTLTSHFTVKEPSAITVAAFPSNITCFGNSDGNINLNVSGGTNPYYYKWSNGALTKDIQQLLAGNYSVQIHDSHNCHAGGAYSLTQPSQLQISDIVSDTRCNGSDDGSITLNITGGTPSYRWLWNNGDTTQNISNIHAGYYTALLTDSNGCVALSDTIPVKEPSKIDIAIAPTDVTCPGASNGSAVVMVTGGMKPYTFIWSNHAVTQNLSNIATGTYMLTVTDVNGCTSVSNTAVDNIPAMVVTGTVNPLICSSARGSVSLEVNNGSPPYSFNWSNGARTEDIDQIEPGTYSVTISDANSCTVDSTFIITDQNSFKVKTSGDATINMGQTVNISAVSSGSSLTSFSWKPSANLNCADCANTSVQPAETTIYTVTAMDTNGCIASATMEITVIPDHNIWLPNAFTPNNDGNNDHFQLYGNLEGIQNIEIMIFDRWGEKVFQSSASDFKWDGVYKGKVLPPAVYAYVLKLVFLDGKEEARNGTTTLIR